MQCKAKMQYVLTLHAGLTDTDLIFVILENVFNSYCFQIRIGNRSWKWQVKSLSDTMELH